MQAHEIQAGHAYRITHSRKGTFDVLVGRIDAGEHDGWLTGTMIDGRTKTILPENSVGKGEAITIRLSLISNAEPLPEAEHQPKADAPKLRLTAGMRVVVRTDGTVTPLDGKQTLPQVYEHIGHGCDTIDAVNLRKHGLVMLVDDNGAIKNPPPEVNDIATALYHAICAPGTTWPIRGNVVIVPDADFE